MVAMSQSPRASIQQCFSTLTDPRRRKVVYPLVNVVTIAICAVLCGADDFVAIAQFGRTKRKWLSQFLDMSTGVPSHDRFNAILGALKVDEFQECLLALIMALHDVTDGQVVAIDGKTLRRSFDRASSKAAIHMVSAWASANHISLGQVVVDEKSNEITAIPKLLKMLEISGCLVTIDAMGCQVDIAQAIVDAQAEYILAVKKNQRTLAQGIDAYFAEHSQDDFQRIEVRRHSTDEKGHGREEHREYVICRVPDKLPGASRWPKLAAIGMVFACVLRDGVEHMECRHYILSKYLSAKRFAQAVRDHWSIENRLHWQLDVTFQEDQCRIRKGNADANFSTLRRTALSLLKNNQSQKVGIKNKRLLAALDEDYLLEVLLGE
jgi:predicted transposase YbfD/YdcC